MNKKSPVWQVVIAGALIALLVIIVFTFTRREEIEGPRTIHYVYMPLVMDDYSGNKAVCRCSGCASVHALGASRVRAWSPAPSQCPGVITHPAVSTVAQAQQILSSTLSIEPDGTDLVFGFNEPYLNGIEPALAAQLYHDIKAMHPDLVIACPGISHYSVAREWLIEFTNIYRELYGEFPCGVVDWHCYWNTAEQCIEQAETMIALTEGWNAQGANITMLTISELGIIPDDEFEEFISWLDGSEIDLWFPFCSEIKNWPQFTMVVPGSTALTSRGQTFKDH